MIRQSRRLLSQGSRGIRALHLPSPRAHRWEPLSSLPPWSGRPYHASRAARFAADSFIDDEIDTANGDSHVAAGSLAFDRFIDGPPLRLGWASFGRYAAASTVGVCGSTVATATVCTAAMEPSDAAAAMGDLLTVDVRFRSHAVGAIPRNLRRRDLALPSEEEVLAARAVDRALRPLLRKNETVATARRWHVQAAVQSYDGRSGGGSGDPVATCLNAAAAALRPHLVEPVAATALCVALERANEADDGASLCRTREGHRLVLVQDPSPAQARASLGRLLLAGTRDRIVMLEWTSSADGAGDGPSTAGGLDTGLPEELWSDLLQLGLAAVQPLLETIEELQTLHDGQTENVSTLNERSNECYNIVDIRSELGLSSASGSDPFSNESLLETRLEPSENLENERLIQEAVQYCSSRIKPSLRLLFGVRKEETVERCEQLDTRLHSFNNLLPKSLRATRETVLQNEIKGLVDEFVNDSRDPGLNTSHRQWLQDKVIDLLFRDALWEAVYMYGARSDQRGTPGTGWKVIRPIHIQAPALPQTVHGSALFRRGETQVLCTVTLGSPSEGQARTNPFEPSYDSRTSGDTDGTPSNAYKALPIGSLRFLRNQQALESDLNSKRVLADREPTGASGNLAELRRAFLQYDFPSYSTGKLPDGGQANKRRSVGHGNLAERAILPVLPAAVDFPYSIRMTSEVTDSNGSSSMATVCGVTMALLDAGVPLRMPVSGVSVGAVVSGNQYALMLDITGTEDYYGAMDLKVAGTLAGVTAIQMDSKQPMPIQAVVDALYLAKAGRRSIFTEMETQTASIGGLKPRSILKESAPCVEVVRFDPQRKRDAVGPGGIVLRQLEDQYGVSLDLTQEGQCLIYGSNRKMVQKAKTTIMELVSDVAVGDVHIGTIIELKDFGAVVELLRNKEGLLHVSEISDDQNPGNHSEGLSGFVREYLKIGQEVEVLVIGVDPVQGSIKLSMKQVKRQRSR